MQRIQIGQPAKYQGLEDDVPPELQPFVEELIRRLTVNHNAIQADVGTVGLGSTTLPAGTAESSTEADARMALSLFQ